MSYVGELINGYGTQVSAFTCDACMCDFTVCPAVEPDERKHWHGCLAETCASYDPARDCDVLFMSDEQIAREKPIEHLAVLLSRQDVAVREGKR